MSACQLHPNCPNEAYAVEFDDGVKWVCDEGLRLIAQALPVLVGASGLAA